MRCDGPIVRNDCLQMAAEEERWNNERQAEMYQKEMRFKHRLKRELDALKRRIEQGRDEQKRQRQIDLEKLLQRYQNVKRELESHQRMERQKFEKEARVRDAAESAKG